MSSPEANGEDGWVVGKEHQRGKLLTLVADNAHW